MNNIQVTATSGVVTGVSPNGGQYYSGVNYRAGDTIRFTNLSGTGAYFIIDKLIGDTVRGGLYGDTTNNRLYQWSGGNSGIHNWNPLLDSANTYVAGNEFTSQTANQTVGTYTVGSLNARFDVSGSIDISAVSGGTVLLQATWTDVNSQSHTKSFYNQGATSDAMSTLNDASTFPPMRIWAKAGTTITISTIITGTITYDVTGTIQYIR
jgi:hypothetical protein